MDTLYQTVSNRHNGSEERKWFLHGKGQKNRLYANFPYNDLFIQIHVLPRQTSSRDDPTPLEMMS